jgi:hypothetical protein
MADEIHCHDADSWAQSLRHTSTWRPPSGEHRYRGMGTFQDGKEKWEPCDICGKRYGHRKHGDPFRRCSYCGSIHPADLLALDFEVIPFDPATFVPAVPPSFPAELQRPADYKPPTVEWADWKYGWPHKLYVTASKAVDHAKFYSIHLSDHPELIEPFNERFGVAGVIFGMDERGLWWKRSPLESTSQKA